MLRRLPISRLSLFGARSLWALLFLAIFVGNGLVEISVLADCVMNAPPPRRSAAAEMRRRPRLLRVVRPLNAEAASPGATMPVLFAGAATAGDRPTTNPAPARAKTCACTLCDESCPGGRRCRCDSHGGLPLAAGLFYVAPPCHPSPAATALAAPSSLAFRFLTPTPEAPTPLIVTVREMPLTELVAALSDVPSSPATPPPEARA